MFTGIVEHVGRLEAVETGEGPTRLRIDVGPLVEGVGIGDSIAVCGACLTVTEIAGSRIVFDVIPETLERTRLGALRPGDGVNLERAMGMGARFDGHLVQGHVDGLGRVRRIDREGADVEFHITCDRDLAAQLVDKGSVTIDGVSLTVVRVVEDGFHVALIPHTLERTTLSQLAVGDPVDLEVDVFGKYVKSHLDRILPGVMAKMRDARDDDTD
jgi:riboflavin synthase